VKVLCYNVLLRRKSSTKVLSISATLSQAPSPKVLPTRRHREGLAPNLSFLRTPANQDIGFLALHTATGETDQCILFPSGGHFGVGFSLHFGYAKPFYNLPETVVSGEPSLSKPFSMTLWQHCELICGVWILFNLGTYYLQYSVSGAGIIHGRKFVRAEISPRPFWPVNLLHFCGMCESSLVRCHFSFLDLSSSRLNIFFEVYMAFFFWFTLSVDSMVVYRVSPDCIHFHVWSAKGATWGMPS
jgi:hypothetical protein